MSIVAGEDRLDERGEGRKVGAQHDDVAQFVARCAVVIDLGEEMQDVVAEDLDLSTSPEGAVPDQRRVGCHLGANRFVVIAGDVALQRDQQ